jgi:uncharacterized phage-associated protein
MKKLKELVLYVSEASREDPEFGATKLNKILFFVDFLAYSAFGHPISGATYFHLSNGPALRQMLAAQDALIAEGRATIEEQPYFGKMLKRMVALKGPDTSIFTAEELKLVQDVIVHLRGIGGKQLSDWTHTLIPWLYSEDKEDIPYNTVFTMFNVPVRRDGVIWGQKELEARSHS